MTQRTLFYRYWTSRKIGHQLGYNFSFLFVFYSWLICVGYECFLSKLGIKKEGSRGYTDRIKHWFGSDRFGTNRLRGQPRTYWVLLGDKTREYYNSQKEERLSFTMPSILIPWTGFATIFVSGARRCRRVAGAIKIFRWDQMTRIVPRGSAREAVITMNYFVHDSARRPGYFPSSLIMNQLHSVPFLLSPTVSTCVPADTSDSRAIIISS